MNIFQAELKYYLRSPIIWLIMALTAFIGAWSLLLSIEIFTSLQVKFSGMSDAPTIMQGIIMPVLASQTKIQIIIIAIIGGLSFARLSNNNSWSMIIASQLPEWSILKQKYFANLLIIMLFILPIFFALASLVIIADLPVFPIIILFTSLLLLIMWMLSLAMFLSSLVNNSGFAILLCIVAFMLFWLFTQTTTAADWGKNWIQVVSPFYHFHQLTANTIAYASVFYFVAGTSICLWLTKLRLVHKRYIL